MPEIIVDSGVCGFVTRIRASSEDQQTVTITYETTCPNAAKARGELTSIDAYAELFRKPHDTAVRVFGPVEAPAACHLSSVLGFPQGHRGRGRTRASEGCLGEIHPVLKAPSRRHLPRLVS